MQNLKQLEQAAEKCAADLNDLKNAIEALKAKDAAPVWPMSVQDLPETPPYLLSITGKIKKSNLCHEDSNTFPTLEAANSAAAFSPLSRLVHHINGGNIYEGGENWYVVEFRVGKLRREFWNATCVLPNCLYFKNEADRDRSMIDHRDLWIQYFTGKKA